MFYIDVMLIYFSAANKNLTEEEIRAKVQELGGKGEEIMTILQEREQKGIEEGIVLGRQEGRQEGIQQGRQEAKIEMVKDLIREGLGIELIAKTSKLTKKQVEEIKLEMNN